MIVLCKNFLAAWRSTWDRLLASSNNFVIVKNRFCLHTLTLTPPGFETSPTVQNPKLGESASFTCVSSGGPATITWRLGDNQIPGGALSGACELTVDDLDYVLFERTKCFCHVLRGKKAVLLL